MTTSDTNEAGTGTMVAELLYVGPLAFVSKSLPLKYELDTLVADVHTIGRAADASLFLDSDEQPHMVSREHLSLRHVSTEDGIPVWRLEDPGSTNGTTINGLRVVRARLCDGDVIGIGGAATTSIYTYRYVLRCAEEDEDKYNQRESVAVHREGGSPDGVLMCGPDSDNKHQSILVLRGDGGRLLYDHSAVFD